MGLPTPARYMRTRLSGSPSERAFTVRARRREDEEKRHRLFSPYYLPVRQCNTASALLSELPRQATMWSGRIRARSAA